MNTFQQQLNSQFHYSAFQPIARPINEIAQASSIPHSEEALVKHSADVLKQLRLSHQHGNKESMPSASKVESTHHSEDSHDASSKASPSSMIIRLDLKRIHEDSSDSHSYKQQKAQPKGRSNEEMAKECSDLAKEIKQLRRKLRCAQEKRVSKEKSDQAEACQQYLKFSQAMSIVKRNSMNLSMPDMMEKLCQSIADGSLNTHSLNFKRICTILRSNFNSDEQIKYRKYEEEGVEVLFPDKKVLLSESEMKAYAEYSNNPQAIRLLSGASQQPVSYYSAQNSFEMLQQAWSLSMMASQYCLCDVQSQASGLR